MSIFNQNLRFLCEKMGLSQQKLADLLELKRGKVAGYFYETQAKPDFHQKLINHFHIDLGKFLTIEMSDENYDSFFDPDNGMIIGEPESSYKKREDVIELLLKARNTADRKERENLIDLAIGAYGKLAAENMELKDRLLKSLENK